MAKKNPVQGALFLGLIAIALVAVSYFVVRPHQEAREKEKERSSLLFSELQREKVIDFTFENAQGNFHLKRRADQKDDWMVENTKTFNADKTSIDGVVSTILSAKKETSVQGQDLVALGLQPPKFKLKITEGTEIPKHELWLGEDTPVDYLVYAKWSDGPEVFLTSRSLRFSLDKKLSELRDKKVTGLAVEKVARMELVMNRQPLTAGKLKFEKGEGGTWTAPAAFGPGKNVNLDKAEIDKFLGAIKDLAVTGFASEDPAVRTKDLGFAHPLAILTLADKDAKDGKEVVWQLSWIDNKKDKTKKLYLARMDKDSTYEVAETFLDNFKVDLFHFRPKNLITTSKAAVTAFSLNDGSNSIEFKKNPASSQWTFKATTPKAETSGVAKQDMIDKALDTITGVKAAEFHDTMTPFSAGLQRPTRIVELKGMKGGQEESIQTLFFGKKTGDKKWVMRTTSMDAPASVNIDLDGVLPAKADTWAVPATPPSADNPPSSGVVSEAQASTPAPKRTKMEATVKNLREIKKLPAAIVKPGKKYTAEITMAKGSKMMLTLAADKAPYTVSNFINLARNHFYDGTKFHRVIKDFMAQGGDPTGTGTGGPGYKFDNEDNDLKHKRGAISMAHAGRNTNGSQFFICYKEQPHLDGVHTVFGEVSQGLETLDAIAQGDVMKTVEIYEE